MSNISGHAPLVNVANYSRPHICQCLSRILTLRRHSTLIIAEDRHKTAEQFVGGVLDLAYGLVELGLRPGDVVAISAFNCDLYLEWLLAIAYVGGISAHLNYRWSYNESRQALEAVKAVMLLTDESCPWYSELQNTLLSLRWHVFMSMSSAVRKGKNVGDLSTEMLKKSFPESFDYCWAPEDAVMICFTSGTTGAPKGATLSHTALIVQSLAKLATVGYNEDDVYLHTAPLCHIGGISSAMAMLMAGGSHVLMPKFDAKSAIEAIEQNSVTSLITVPTIMADLISIIRLKEKCLGKASVKKILNGGGSFSVELLKDAIKFFPKAKLISAYGMTETCSSLTFMTLHDPTMSGNTEQHLWKVNAATSSVDQHGGVCVGKPAPHVELKISIGDSSSSCGRILTRGPHVMLCYWGRSQMMTSDGMQDDWLDTGDIGQIDEQGNLWLIGRRNGRIKSGGENVYPEEVEAALLQHPGICRVVVVGLPHHRLSEMVVACIQIKENWQLAALNVNDHAKQDALSLSSEMLKNYVKQRNLSGFKVPKVFILWENPFPLTSTGKVKREQVRKEAALQLQTITSRL